MAIMEVLQSSMELSYSSTDHEQRYPHEQKDSSFRHEQPYQYTLYSTLTNTPILSVHEFKRGITQLLWPRLVLLRTKQVLAALLPLFNLTEDGSFGLVLNGLSYSLSSLGWALHGMRLLINTVQLLQHTIPGDWISDSDKELGWRKRFDTEFNRTWTEFCSDLIWIFSTLAPASLNFTVGFLIVDLVWVGFRAWIEIDRLISKSRDHEKAMSIWNSPTAPRTYESIAHQHLAKQIAYEQKKLIINLGQLLAISTVIIVRSFVLPALMPVLATNPIMLLICASLILTLTLINHYLSQQLAEQKPPELIEEKINTSQALVTSRDTFFKTSLRTVKTKSPTEPLDDVNMLTA